MKIEFTVKRNPIKQSEYYLKEIETNYEKLSIIHSIGNTIIAEGDVKYLTVFVDLVDYEFGIISTHIIPVSSEVKIPVNSYTAEVNLENCTPDPKEKDTNKGYKNSKEGIADIIKPILNTLDKKDVMDKNISKFLSQCGVDNITPLLKDIFKSSLKLNIREINYTSLTAVIKENPNAKITEPKVNKCLKNMFTSFSEKYSDMPIFKSYERFTPLIIVRLFAEYFQK